jgi:hypothetical protein
VPEAVTARKTPKSTEAKAEPPAVTAAGERLYGLPLEDFTATRNSLARETGKDGNRQDAEAIRSLEKPSTAAWALNRLARSHGEAVRRLVDAGERLRGAQEQLLAGGDREAFREASNLEQQLISELTAEAVQIARDSGAAGTQALERRVADTLRAAALDPAVADRLLRGRLVREQASAGLAGGLPADGSASKARGKPRRSDARAAEEQLRRAERRLRDAERTEQSARKRHESAGRQTARLRERAEEALERLRAAEADQQDAEQSLERASEDRSRLARKAEELRTRAGG